MAIDFELDSSQSIQISDSSDLSDFTEQTIAAWIWVESALPSGNTRGIVSHFNANIGFAFALYNNAGTLQMQYGVGNGTMEWEAVNWAFGTGTWYHVAVVYDDAANTVKFYVNGVQQGTTQANTQSIGNSTAVVVIGIRSDGYPWDGLLEDVRVFNRVLSDTELAVLAAKYTKALGGEVGWWKCNRANGIPQSTWNGANLAGANTIPDDSSRGGVGTPVNTPLGYTNYLNWFVGGSQVIFIA